MGINQAELSALTGGGQRLEGGGSKLSKIRGKGGGGGTHHLLRHLPLEVTLLGGLRRRGVELRTRKLRGGLLLRSLLGCKLPEAELLRQWASSDVISGCTGLVRRGSTVAPHEKSKAEESFCTLASFSSFAFRSSSSSIPRSIFRLEIVFVLFFASSGVLSAAGVAASDGCSAADSSLLPVFDPVCWVHWHRNRGSRQCSRGCNVGPRRTGEMGLSGSGPKGVAISTGFDMKGGARCTQCKATWAHSEHISTDHIGIRGMSSPPAPERMHEAAASGIARCDALVTDAARRADSAGRAVHAGRRSF